MTERAARFLPGLRMLVLGIALVLAGVAVIVLAGHQGGGAAKALIGLGIVAFIASALALRGLTAALADAGRLPRHASIGSEQGKRTE